ncbi:D-2-hydroxyacid dehydrogenase [Prevotella sp. A2931]|uniref:D-2-hydroxyacid dehydrogenase n=1 Tax=Prevotella illustrans TaxID=2800387 RepID=A0ABS3M3D2_9BACT|nr:MULTISPECIES: D-2-hydroxyacid dehydrogenase [Prevotella]MBO1362683.1 D-2-hydroxyacid dehydrogenase [Prevotella illustrans]PTL25152.1 glycerate dehydrogenase [Prevotella sp. oral taxon 820]
MKIVELDGHAVNPGDLSWDGLKDFGELVVYPRTPAEKVVERAQGAEIILVNKVKITEEILDQLPTLRYIGILATGYNVVDIDAAKKRGIIVTNIPAYSTDSVAQMTFAHILTVFNRVEHYASQTRKGRWSSNPDFCYWDTPLYELAGKTLGIVGMGNIGKKVACIALNFGMDVFAFTSKNATELPAGVQKTTFEGLLSVSDILSLHCPLTPSTHYLINHDTLQKMKKNAILVNTGRGALIEESAVAEALEQGRLGAYCADVMTEEPPSANNPLFAQPNAFITPHIAWATFEARKRLIEICISNVRAYIEGHPINVVNS